MEDLNLDMFRAYDLRTPAPDLTPQLAERLARAEARYCRDHLGTTDIILARDARLTGPAYLEQGAGIFRDLGFNVLIVPGVSSTCHFYYNCMRRPEAAGIMYGASHNPGSHTGQKIVGPGLAPIAENIGPAGGLRRIREIYTTNEGLASTAEGGSITTLDYLGDYIDYSLGLAGVRPGDLSGCRIMQDFLCGAAGAEFTAAFDLAGAQTEARNQVPDGHFPAGQPNPVVPEVVGPATETLRTGDFHFGMVFDGDGDRIDFLAPDGSQLSPGFNLSLLVKPLARLFPSVAAPHVYVDLKSSPLAQMRLVRQDIAYRIIRNGHSQIKEALRRNWDRGFIGAVEESSHYFLNFPIGQRVFPSENTLFFGLLTAKNWHAKPESYANALAEQETTFREREWGYVFPDDEARQRALDLVETAFRRRGAGVMDQDEDGRPMDATLIRQGLPFLLRPQDAGASDWTQISQRVSQSENSLARWEVTAGAQARLDEARQIIEQAADDCGAGERSRG